MLSILNSLFGAVNAAAAACRRCAAEVGELNHSVMGAAELLLQHASNLRSGIEELSNRVGSLSAEVRAAEAMLA
jgi:hypothetical protein